jgi:hypothetical protein
VKTPCADGSVAASHARVGHCQAPHARRPQYESTGAFFCLFGNRLIPSASLDDPSCFRPKVAIFTRNRPAWALIPPEVTVFEGTPG